jgi:hypothetical protein
MFRQIAGRAVTGSDTAPDGIRQSRVAVSDRVASEVAVLDSLVALFGQHRAD